MFGLLLALLLLDGIVLMVVVLLQAGKGGGLAAMGGGMSSDSFIGGRQAANLLTKTTWVTGAIFLSLSLVLSIMSTRQREAESVLQQEFRQQAPAGAPVTPIVPGAQPQAPAGEAPAGQRAPDPAAGPAQEPLPPQQ